MAFRFEESKARLCTYHLLYIIGKKKEEEQRISDTTRYLLWPSLILAKLENSIWMLWVSVELSWPLTDSKKNNRKKKRQRAAEPYRIKVCSDILTVAWERYFQQTGQRADWTDCSSWETCFDRNSDKQRQDHHSRALPRTLQMGHTMTIRIRKKNDRGKIIALWVSLELNL